MRERFPEQIFFFGILGLTGYMIWQIVAPFVSALILAAIIATVGHPLYARMLRIMPRHNKSLAAFFSVIVIACTIFVPLLFLGYLLFVQALAFYDTVGGGGIAHLQESLNGIEQSLGRIAPGFSLDIANYARQASGWLAANIGSIFASTASTIFGLFIMLVALFYMFKDGEWFTEQLVRLSPLPDTEDTHILQKMGTSVRTVVLGTLSVALIQGILTAIGFALFGVPQAILWGSVAAIGALVPGVGTSFVFVGAVVVALLSDSYGVALGLTIWGVFAVGLIDNLLGPYLMSRGSELHPFMVLLSVLGGISLFGPIGFLVGPVALSLFTVLLELYSRHLATPENHVG